MKIHAFVYFVLVVAVVAIFDSCTADELESKDKEPFLETFRLDPVQLKSWLIGGNSTGANPPTVHFNSYTYWNPKVPDVLTPDWTNISAQLRNSYFDASRTTIFVTHGWMENGKSSMCERLLKEYLIYDDVNVVIVDWKGDTFLIYDSAVEQVSFVSSKIVEMLDQLVIHAHLDLDRTILVGNSIGAHIMGIAGKKMKEKVKTIVGLDPALRGFREVDDTERLSRSSAKYVQVIHTNGANYGFNEPLGSADFYANNGINQPGCLNYNICSHKRAWQYFAESINSAKGFFGTKCSSYEHLLRLQLDTNEVVPTCDLEISGLMGGIEPDEDLQGIFVFETAARAPFALGECKQISKSL